MKIDQLLNEHKKGVKAIKYAKKPQPLIGPEAQKKKAKAKAEAPKTELEKHTKLAAKLKEDVDFEFDAKLAKILKERGYKGPLKLEQLGMKWIEAVGDIVDIDDGIMVKGPDPEYDSWVAYVYEMGQYAYGAEQGYQTGNAKSVEKNTRDQGVAETAKLSTREKFKRSLKRAGYDPDAGAKRIEDLLAKQKKEREEREKKEQEQDMKEAKQPEAPKPRNFVAKNAKTAGAGAHKDAKKASKEVRGQKHKNKDFAEDTTEARFSGLKPRWNKKPVIQHYNDEDEEAWKNDPPIKDPYHKARAERIKAALQQYKDERFPDLKEGEWDQQSDEIIPPEYEMDPEELQALRNTEFSDEEKLQAMVKLAAGGTSDEEIAQMFDLDKETVANILDDYIEDIEAAMDPEDDVKEAEMGKIIDYKPGQTATLNTGPGMTTIVDLKKNPTSLTKDPATGKLKLVGPQAQGTPGATSAQASTIKPGDAVEIGKVESIQDIRRLSGLK